MNSPVVDSPQAAVAPTLRGGRAVGLVATLILGVLSYQLNASMITPALPDIARALHEDVGAVSQVSSLFFLAGAVGGVELSRWSDFIGRVGGVGPKSAVNFSKEGLTVNGKKYSAAAAARAEAKAKSKDHPDKDAKKASAGARNRSAAEPSAPRGDATPKPEAAVPAAAASATKN